MSTTGVPGCLPLMARSRSSPERPGILMSETTRSKGSSPSSSSACSAVEAVVTWQWFEEKADTRNRSTDALSSTSRTRRSSGRSSPVVSSCAAILLVTGRPFLCSEFASSLLRPAELVQELEPLTREPVFREVQRLESRGRLRPGRLGLRRSRSGQRRSRGRRALSHQRWGFRGRRGRSGSRRRGGRLRGGRTLRRLREEVRTGAARRATWLRGGLGPHGLWDRSGRGFGGRRGRGGRSLDSLRDHRGLRLLVRGRLRLGLLDELAGGLRYRDAELLQESLPLGIVLRLAQRRRGLHGLDLLRHLLQQRGWLRLLDPLELHGSGADRRLPTGLGSEAGGHFGEQRGGARLERRYRLGDGLGLGDR